MIICIWLLLGLLLGSFANVCIVRLPADQSIWGPRSQCPRCGNRIAAWDNVPLLSFLLLQGKCRRCRERISYLYPAIEALMALSFVFNTLLLGRSALILAYVQLFTFYFITISVIDFQHRIIPDELSLSMVGLGLLLAWFNPMLSHTHGFALLESFLSALAGGAFMLALAWLGEKTFKQEALGGGDIKLIAGVGALLGWHGVFGAIFWGSLLGSVAGLALILTRKLGRRDVIPFGPFLGIGAYLTCVLPSEWLRFIFP